MKRDMDLIRRLLLYLEGEEHLFLKFDGTEEEFNGLDRVFAIRHLELMANAGLIDAECTYFDSRDSGIAIVRGITWEGYEFLEAAREDNTWKKVRSAVGNLSFELIKHTLLTIGKQEAERLLGS